MRLNSGEIFVKKHDMHQIRNILPVRVKISSSGGFPQEGAGTARLLTDRQTVSNQLSLDPRPQVLSM